MRAFLLVIAALCAGVCPAYAAGGGAGVLLVDDFNADAPGHFPTGWKARDEQTAERVYTVASENGEKYLKAVAKGVSAQIGMPVKASVDAYPVLSWRWRVDEIPAGADERVAATNDSAAGVYVVFKGSFGGLIPRAVKYVWSAREPRGAAFPSPGYSTAQIVVLESGTEAAGQWRIETVNFAADYRRLFKAEPPELQGIAVLTDSDNTGSRAAADYADFRLLAALKTADASDHLTATAKGAASSDLDRSH